MDALRAALLTKAAVAEPGEALLTHESDLSAATAALQALERACDALATLSLDCATLDIEDALAHLHEITGTTQEALIDRVFASFCLGK